MVLHLTELHLMERRQKGQHRMEQRWERQRARHQMEQRWVLRNRQAQSQMGQHLGRQNQPVQTERRFRLEQWTLRRDLSQQQTMEQRMELHLRVLLLNQTGRQMVQRYPQQRTFLQRRSRVLLSRQLELIRKASLSPRVLELQHRLEHDKQRRW
jgi:hypothetical protein